MIKKAGLFDLSCTRRLTSGSNCRIFLSKDGLSCNISGEGFGINRAIILGTSGYLCVFVREIDRERECEIEGG